MHGAGYTTGEWSDAEVMRLVELFTYHHSWPQVCRQLNRSPPDCIAQWQSVVADSPELTSLGLNYGLTPGGAGHEGSRQMRPDLSSGKTRQLSSKRQTLYSEDGSDGSCAEEVAHDKVAYTRAVWDKDKVLL